MASEHDRAAMAALVERVNALEKPWYGRRGKTRVHWVTVPETPGILDGDY